ncbi:MAG: type I DNA topoisomerase [Bacteroidia bacterium]|nr:type I DNA topoisomerase [Bacteroidia bacterium]
MAKNLVIVESPAKAKTIEKFLGNEFKVKSSVGHIRDLVKKGMGVDLEDNFRPSYEISPDKRDVVSELKKLAKDADMVWLATDEDREGEAISWHLFEVLGLKKSKYRRIVYHEITKTAIQDAINSPREIDLHLVNAQQARRVLDRLVGFELSPILWKKVRSNLSAGRVQSVAVRLIVEREREIMGHESRAFYKVTGFFLSGTALVKAELDEKFNTEAEAQKFLEQIARASFTVQSIEKKPGKRTPAAPFTTSTLQQEASRKLGFSVSQTMTVAQRLYEAGKITYMRTDSVNLSGFAINACKNEIHRLFGEEYSHKRQFSTKSAGAQEAHEAIRPTYMSNRGIDSGEPNEHRLYELIWKRTIASQMSDAKLEKTIVKIGNNQNQHSFTATGEVILFDGFLKVYMESSDEEGEEDEGILPAMNEGETLGVKEITAVQKFTAPPARYSEASLVKKMEQLGIGRPSTYAPTISTIVKRQYIVKESREGRPREYTVLRMENGKVSSVQNTETTGAEKARLFPTDVGMVVTDFLQKNFPHIMDYHFTAKVEEEFDEIAEGKLDWTAMLKEFYSPFHKTVEKVEETSERATGERKLGVDPKTGKNVFVRIGRFGPLVQMGETVEGEPKPKFAGLRKDQRMETLTLEEALDLFKLPRNMGTYEEKELVVNIGRFGPYIRHGDEFISLPKGEDPYSVSAERVKEILRMPRLPRPVGQLEGEEITANKGRFGPYLKFKNGFYSLKKTDDPFAISLERAVELIEEKREKERKSLITEFPSHPELKVVHGRYGPCIKLGKKFFKIPAGKTPEDLTLEECLALTGGGNDKAKSGDKKAKASPKKSKTQKPEKAGKKPAAPKKKAPAKKKPKK